METESPDQIRTEKFKTILQELRIVFRAIQAHSRMVEQKSGLSSAQLWMLWELFNSPGLKVSELAKILSIHLSTCSNMLDKIAAKGLVLRERTETDQRVVRLYLTEEGTRLLADAPRPAQGALTEALMRLPDASLDDLERGLVALVRTLKTADEAASMQPITE